MEEGSGGITCQPQLQIAQEPSAATRAASKRAKATPSSTCEPYKICRKRGKPNPSLSNSAAVHWKPGHDETRKHRSTQVQHEHYFYCFRGGNFRFSTDELVRHICKTRAESTGVSTEKTKQLFAVLVLAYNCINSTVDNGVFAVASLPQDVQHHMHATECVLPGQWAQAKTTIKGFLESSFRKYFGRSAVPHQTNIEPTETGKSSICHAITSAAAIIKSQRYLEANEATRFLRTAFQQIKTNSATQATNQETI